MIVYCDSSELALVEDTPLPNIIVVGGVAVRRDRHHEFLDGVRMAKGVWTGDSHVPVKWNIRDFRDVITERFGEEFYHDVAPRSDEIRAGMLEALREAGGTCFTSVIQSYTRREESLRALRMDLTRFCFVNILQRLGLYADNEIEGEPDAQLVLDWPSNSNRDPWETEYRPAWAEGEPSTRRYGNDYHSGPLQEQGFRPGLLFGNTEFNEGLQVADLVVGVTRRYVERVHDDQEVRDWSVQQFSELLPHFHQSWNGDVVGSGIVVSGSGRLEENIREGIHEFR